MSRDDVAVCVPIDPLFVGSSCQDKQFGTLGIKRKSCCTTAGRFGCACKGCKGDVRFGALADPSSKPGIRVRCKWRHKHWAHMKKHGLDPKQVAGHYSRFLASHGKTLPPLSARASHLIDIWLYRRPDLQLINVSQSVDRAAARERPLMSCVTPGGAFLCVKANRLMLPIEKMIMMGLPIHKMDFGVNRPSEVHSLAGNAMHTKAMEHVCKADADLFWIMLV